MVNFKLASFYFYPFESRQYNAQGVNANKHYECRYFDIGIEFDERQHKSVAQTFQSDISTIVVVLLNGIYDN